jgi:preprotein translocase subunit YajC
VESLASLLPLVGIAVLFWLLLIRPAQRRQRELRSMQSSLAVGDEVMLTSGVYGVLRSVDDERIRVEVAPGVELSVARGAIGNVVTKAELSGAADRSPVDSSAGTEESDPGTTAPETTSEDR